MKNLIVTVKEQINDYISKQPESKRSEIGVIHKRILRLLPKCKLWFLDGKDDKGKIVSTPNIG